MGDKADGDGNVVNPVDGIPWYSSDLMRLRIMCGAIVRRPQFSPVATIAPYASMSTAIMPTAPKITADSTVSAR